LRGLCRRSTSRTRQKLAGTLCDRVPELAEAWCAQSVTACPCATPLCHTWPSLPVCC